MRGTGLKLTAPLSDEEMDRLDAFLIERGDEDFDDESGDAGVLDLSELDGLLTAVVSGPGSVAPSQWLPAVWGEQEPAWERTEDIEEMLGLLIRHMNGIAATLGEQPDAFEPIFLDREVDGKSALIVDEWCEGYMRGVALEAEQWAGEGDQMNALLEPIRAFTQEAGWPAHDLASDREVETLQEAVTLNARAIYAYWQARREALVPQPVRRAGPRVGRNERCPCGSGKKYKHCCLQ